MLNTGMNVSVSDIECQLSLGEDSLWEFKAIDFAGHRLKGPSRDQLADEIAAFANTKGGILVCGVNDSGNTQGLSREEMDSLETIIKEVCMDAIKPSVHIYILRKKLTSGDPVLVVSIPQGNALHKSPGGRFRRVGSSKCPMNTDEELRLAQLRSQARFIWFDKQTVPDTGYGTLDEDLWISMLSAEGAAKPQAALHQLRLLAQDETSVLCATVAGILLCTRKPHEWLPNAVIMATSYDGHDRASNQIDAKEITGPLHRQIGDAMQFVRRNMQVAARKVPARVDMPQFSLRAVFEAMVNAVVHRDYSIRERRIRLSMFKDRLEITSPGELPNGMTIDAMKATQATRNEAIASVFGRMSVSEIHGAEQRQYLMERRGDGVRIILRETMELCGKAPEYEVLDDKELRLTIPSALLRINPNSSCVRVLVDGKPLPDVAILVLYPNKTWLQATTGYDGEGIFELYTTDLPLKVFVAAPGYAAYCEEQWQPAEGVLTIELDILPEGGSVIMTEGTGHIPGLSGRLNPIRDTNDRTYLYASNIAINEGKQQPVNFLFGQEIRLTDAFGQEFWIRIVDIAGSSALIEYRSVPLGGTDRS
ncbi:MAG: putative DNA binding domain-containing protein [Gammaproteobacteria bacterium]|nr:putative DNA binding domain-containing protein [Gammaproteobacteria bacterium]